MECGSKTSDGTSGRTEPLLPMGWALKASQATRSRFTEKQKNYPIQQFEIGESSGMKLNATAVAKSMLAAKDSNGMKLLTKDEFLTSQQISNFFSRVSAKKSLAHAVADTDDATAEGDLVSVTQELHRSKICAHIQDEICISHPICYDQYNICELVQNSKLTQFTVKLLQNISESFDITHVKGKRKAPYIAELAELVKGCSCQK
jgi:Arf-GAP/Rho-GAP domain/ANK repeat/PH domain-containing protein 3